LGWVLNKIWDKAMSNGSALLITTNDQQLIEAIHQFIAFQTGQHQGH
jgi:TusA-related sulfurtransferase